MNNFERVKEFHEKFGSHIEEPFSTELVNLRTSLMREELEEVEDELLDLQIYLWNQRPLDPPLCLEVVDKAALTKELCDLLYVVYGTGVAFGLPLQEAFEEVHRSNMSKLGKDGKPMYREDGKVLKGPNYKETNLEELF